MKSSKVEGPYLGEGNLQVKDCDFFRLDPVMQKQYSMRLGTKVYLLIGLAGDGNK